MEPTRLSSSVSSAVIVAVLLAGAAACNPERNKECDRFTSAMKPLAEGTPTADAVDRVRAQVEGLDLQDQPLHIYAKNYAQTLTVLANTLRLQGDPNAPDGTEDVVKRRLKSARTDADDVGRYCAE